MPYRQIEHTADIALEIEAGDEPSLLREGARAVVDLLTGEASIEPTVERTIELEALDAEDRFVRWLNEVLVLAIVEGFLVGEAKIELRADTGLRAVVRGELAADRIQTELKSVTYHHLALERGSQRCRARVVIDV